MLCVPTLAPPSASGFVPTFTVTSNEVEDPPLVSVQRSTYVPAAEKVAPVTSAAELSKVTLPAPLNFVHAIVVPLRPALSAVRARPTPFGICTVETVGL